MASIFVIATYSHVKTDRNRIFSHIGRIGEFLRARPANWSLYLFRQTTQRGIPVHTIQVLRPVLWTGARAFSELKPSIKKTGSRQSCFRCRFEL